MGSVFITWLISCHISTSEMSCSQSGRTEHLQVLNQMPLSGTLCDAVVPDDSRLMCNVNFIGGSSYLNITLPETTVIRNLEINCGSICSYLHVTGSYIV